MDPPASWKGAPRKVFDSAPRGTRTRRNLLDTARKFVRPNDRVERSPRQPTEDRHGNVGASSDGFPPKHTRSCEEAGMVGKARGASQCKEDHGNPRNASLISFISKGTQGATCCSIRTDLSTRLSPTTECSTRACSTRACSTWPCTTAANGFQPSKCVGTALRDSSAAATCATNA